MLLFEESKVKSTKQKARGKAKTNAHTQLFATEPILNGKYDVRPEFECTFYTPYVRTWILELEIFVYQFNEVKKFNGRDDVYTHLHVMNEAESKTRKEKERGEDKWIACVCLKPQKSDQCLLQQNLFIQTAPICACTCTIELSVFFAILVFALN